MQSLIFEQALWHVFQRIGIMPAVLRGDTIRMAGVQQNISYLKELLERKPRALPPEIAARAKEIL